MSSIAQNHFNNNNQFISQSRLSCRPEINIKGIYIHIYIIILYIMSD